MKAVKLNHKIATIKKLKEIGIKDEKDLQAADFDLLLSVPGISIQELKIMSEMKKAVKQNRLLSYLMKEDCENDNQRDEEHGEQI